MEHEIACIVTNDFFYIQLKKKLQSLIGYKLKKVCIQKGIPYLAWEVIIHYWCHHIIW